MDQWEYQMLVVDLAGSKPSINKMWGVATPDGLTDWHRLQNMGKEGWELVSTVPVIGQLGLVAMAITTQIVFTFKRRLQPQSAAQPSAPQP